jgi:hypothetical protein
MPSLKTIMGGMLICSVSYLLRITLVILEVAGAHFFWQKYVEVSMTCRLFIDLMDMISSCL